MSDIFELDLRLKAYSLVGLGRLEIIRKRLAGEIPSSTRLTRLVIVTNDLVDVAPARFETLPWR